MKRLSSATIASILLACSLGIAQDKRNPDECPSLEYSELKDQSKENLLHDLCMDAELVDIQLELATKLAGLNPEDSHEAHRQATNCVVQMGRIERVLENKYEVKNTKKECEVLMARWKKEYEERKKKEYEERKKKDNQ
jgi:hypothetical protein